MPVPELPPEVWFRISTFLDTSSLSSLSQVNQTFHKIATDESHFRRFIPTSRNCYTHPAQLFRRQRALSHAPTTCLSIQQTSQSKIFCTVQDNLLLFEDSANFLVAFPSGATFDTQEIIGPFTPCVFDQPPFYSLELVLRKLYAILPGGHIAFTNDFRPEQLTVLNIINEDIVRWEIDREEEVASRRIVDNKSIVPAGNDAEWLAFHAAKSTISLFDWRKGTLVRDITDVPSGDIKAVMGECPTTDSMSLVGMFSEKTVGSMREVKCKGFDDVEMIFKVDRESNVDVVLRSADKKTHVVITSIREDDEKRTEFLACRKGAEGLKWWNGRLDMWTERDWPELRENGRVISAKRGVTLMSACDSDYLPKHIWIVLKDDGSVHKTGMPMLSGPDQPTDRTQPIWHRRTHDGGFALTVGIGREGNASADIIDLVELVSDGNVTDELELQRWYCRTLTDWCVVADHFIVAKRCRGGTICVYHFDEFCRTAGGIYKCPGLIPEKYKVKKRESHARKRRKRPAESSSQRLPKRHH